MKQSSGDARSSRRDAMGGQFHAPLPTFLRMNQSTRRIFQQSTTQTRLTTTSGISQLSRMPIKNMTEMYNNIPAPDYMKQLATIIGMD